ncbi:MAG: hypothetical protein ABIG99_00115, partial [Patescibacteria group bacterium]
FFSFASVVFLFGFVYLITDRNKWIALLAVFYYSTSTTFLGYADSLNNTPVDDFWKGLILFLSIYVFKKVSDEKTKKRFEKMIWFLFFVLAISSYDSTFFVFFWLCALSYVVTKKINIRKYLFWASAPVGAFIVQMTQNVWYLGFKDMLLDVWGAFFVRSTGMPPILSNFPPIAKNLLNGLSNTGLLTDLRSRFALPLIISIIYILYKRKMISKLLLYFIIVLGLGGAIYGSLLTIPGIFGYQGRQMAPALLVVFAIATYEVILMLRKLKIKKSSVILLALVLLLWVAHFKATFGYVVQWPNNTVATEKVQYWQELNRITEKYTIILGLEDTLGRGTGWFMREYYVGRLMLPFENLESLFYWMDRINSAISAGSDFLLILPKEDEEKAADFIRTEGIYSFEIRSGENLQKNFSYLRVIPDKKW